MSKPVRRLPRARSMITAVQPEAADAGAAILRAGGSAVDAVLAAALVQGVVDPLMCGIGGFGILHIYDPATGTHEVIDGQGGCPASATPDMWADRIVGETRDGFGFILKGFENECGHAAVCVPGIVAVMAQAHAKFGKLPWSGLFDSAIARAEKGWIVRPHNAMVFTQNERQYGRMNYGEKLGVTEDGRRIYLDKEGGYRKLGDTIRNPELAGTLRELARDGAETFYRGAIAQRIVDDMKQHGGLLSAKDLGEFSTEVHEPLSVMYRGTTYTGNRPPGGGALIAEMLRILEHFDLAALGHNTPEYIRVVSEAMRIATRDKDAHISDPHFVDPELDRLLGDDYTAACAEQIRRGMRTEVPRMPTGDPRDTTHVSCVDSNGMVVSLTHSLGIPSGVIVPGTGFMLNGAMSVFDPRPGKPGSIAPGKRRFSSMCPSILFQNDVPVLTLGAPGGTWISPAVLQVILNVLDWGMGIQEAISAPRFVATGAILDISNRISYGVQAEMEAMGYTVKRSPLSYAFAGVHGISMFDGVLDGGADPQRDGMAIGVV
jgi:gamma-glutamyltranspeptidase / glutathione hydrolase